MKTAALLFTLALLGPAVQAQSRGALLYDTHCIACHSTQMHWRDAKAARDWPGLLAQVQRWQASIGLNWSDEDIAAVAAHLNQRYYRYPRPVTPA